MCIERGKELANDYIISGQGTLPKIEVVTLPITILFRVIRLVMTQRESLLIKLNLYALIFNYEFFEDPLN
jgi:hypothetical protein